MNPIFMKYVANACIVCIAVVVMVFLFGWIPLKILPGFIMGAMLAGLMIGNTEYSNRRVYGPPHQEIIKFTLQHIDKSPEEIGKLFDEERERKALYSGFL